MTIWRKNFKSIGIALILTTCITQPIGYAAEIKAPEKSIYMVNNGTAVYSF